LNDKSGNEKTALKYMLKAVKVDPMNGENWFTLGDTYFKYNTFESARMAYERVVELEPHNAEIWLDYSAVFAEQDDMDTAVETIMKGIEKQPQNPDLFYRLAGYLAKKGRIKLACEHFEMALQMNYEAHQLLFEFYPELKSNMDLLNLVELYRSE